MPNLRQDKSEYSRKRNRNILIRFIIKLIDILVRNTVPSDLRIWLYRRMGVNIGKNVFVGLDSMLDSSFPELITIEDNVTISFRVMLICHDDAKGLQSTDSKRDDRTVAGILLKQGCYIGAGAIILPGVIIGEDAIVGAGAVVNKDVLPNTKVAGVPARVIQEK